MLRKAQGPSAPSPYHAMPLPGMLWTQQVVQDLEQPRLCQAGPVPPVPMSPGATGTLEGRRRWGAREKDRFNCTEGLGKLALFK